MEDLSVVGDCLLLVVKSELQLLNFFASCASNIFVTGLSNMLGSWHLMSKSSFAALSLLSRVDVKLLAAATLACFSALDILVSMSCSWSL